MYKDLGSFTFKLKNAKSLAESSSWQVKYENRSFQPLLKFKKNRLLVVGGGVDDDERHVDVKIDLRPLNMTNWEAYYKVKDGTKLLIIEGLTFNEIDSTMQAKWTSDG